MTHLARTTSRAAFALLTAFALAACGSEDGGGGPVAPSVLTTLTVTLPAASIQAGSTTNATVAALDQYGNAMTAGTVTWSTTAPSVAVVSSEGVVTGVGPGTAQVIATAGGRAGQATLTVTPAPPVLTTVNVTLPATSLTFGQTITAAAAGLDQNGAAIATGSVAWSSSAPAIATVNATTGVVTGVSAGTAQIIATAGGRTGQLTVTITAPPAVRINEVESNGGTPGDWVELYNASSATVDLSNWIFRDNDPTHTYRLPAGTIIAPGAYLVLEEAAFGFGLGGAEDARLANPFDVLVDSYTWTAHAATTYARCPNGSGAFATSTASTKGTANSCAPTAPVLAPWPGSDDVTTVDGVSVFNTNLSGLTYEGAGTGRPAALWAVRNGPGTLYRLIFNGSIWTPDPAAGWITGKPLRYPNGTGNPDAEGVTYAAGGSAGGIYVAVERNNDASTVSRNSILRFDPSSSDTALRATNEWNITSDLPVVGANLGIEAITWIPDSFLVEKGFFDETTGRTYAPADYPNHGTGLFFVGVEGNGIIYAYALDHVTNTARRVASFSSGNPGVMALEFDRETGYLWSTCDDTCGNKAGILEIETTGGAANRGRFRAPREFAKPGSMPNINNEGFAFAPQSECVNNRKPVFWADDSETGGHALRRATIPCGTVARTARTTR